MSNKQTPNSPQLADQKPTPSPMDPEDLTITHIFLRESNIEKVCKLTGYSEQICRNMLSAAKNTIDDQHPNGYNVVRIPRPPIEYQR